MAVAWKKVAFAGDVELAEAEAMNFSINIAVQSGLTPLVIESVAKSVVETEQCSGDIPENLEL